MINRFQGHDVVSVTSSLVIDTLQLMRMVVCHDGHFILTPTTEQLPPGGEDEDDESDNESGCESSLPSATKPTKPTTAVTHTRR